MSVSSRFGPRRGEQFVNQFGMGSHQLANTRLVVQGASGQELFEAPKLDLEAAALEFVEHIPAPTSGRDGACRTPVSAVGQRRIGPVIEHQRNALERIVPTESLRTPDP